MAKLTYAQRKKLPNREFAISQTREYPIEDIAHARNALARVSNGSPEEQWRVRKEVYARYPQLIPNRQPYRYTVAARGKNTGEIIGKSDVIAFVKKANAEGRKVVLYYMGKSQTGKPVFRYQARGLRPSLKTIRAASIAELRRVHARRSEKAQTIDEARSNATTIRSGDERVADWKHDPGSADISGIDTKGKYPMHESSQSMGRYRGITGAPDRAIPGSQKGRVEVSKVTGSFKNVVVKENGKPIVAVAALNPDNEGMRNAYLRTDSTGKSVISNQPPTVHGDAQVEAVLKREFPSDVSHGSVTLKKVPVKQNRHYSPQVRELAMRKSMQSGTDLGAGVVRHGRRQHLKMG